MHTLAFRARPLWFVAASSILSFHTASWAQAPGFELEPVTVTGSGTPRTLGSEIAATSVLTRGDIERSGARDAVQVLNLLGTALVEQQGGAGTLAAVRIRGADSRDTLVLVDGVPLNDVASGQALIQQIPADMIERVEVVRGNLSALYGANATGGVIQIFTRRGTPGAVQPRVSGGAGDRGTRSLNASIGAGSEAVSGRLAVGTERTDGFSASNAPTANPDDDGNERDHATLGIDVRPATGHLLGLDLRRIDGTVQYDSASSFSAPTDTHTQHLVQTGATLRGAHELGPKLNLSWRWAQSKERRKDTVVGGFSFVNDNSLDSEGAVVQLEGVIAEGWRAQFGLERLSQSTDSASYIRNDRDTDVARLGTTYDAPWGSVQANLRHDRTSDFGSATTGLLGGVFKLSGGLSAVASASTSFTPPTLDFLFFDCGPFACSNPDLRPERSRNVEVGLQWQDAVALYRATLFSVRHRDKIANDENFVPQNHDRVKNQGLELTARQAVGHWTLLGEATFQDPKIEATDTRPIRRARQQFALRADFQQARWHAGAGLRYIGDRLDNGGSFTLPSYTVVDASAHWTVAPEWTLSARIDNLFDRRYEPTVGYNGRPRGFFVGAAWSPRP
ncbi:TonB-dependent receptor plug domain-containing protein [Piscinibacter sp.]|uniref:TonB-dependent receptor plug domain-containing protein n=1 Tax=Piscinibacter sp. TaxID=1903157 RepID=UPI002B82C858|nr:TonB-dependent receptor [Albitalea sp.]HUG24328.1 TonB-dependent receptor [Albitalea sp.]